MDDTLAEAHTSLAYARWLGDLDWSGAEREFRRAIELNSNYVMAREWYAEYLAALGRHEEALAEIQKAQQLDPLSVPGEPRRRTGCSIFEPPLRRSRSRSCGRRW